jgi:hypothetical protein
VGDMVKGEHLRPLLGFGVVCVTAALIMGTGLGTPSVTGIVAAPHVRAVPDTPALVLGQTLDHAATPEPASSASARSSTTGPAATPAAVERESAVLASLSVPAMASAAPSATAATLHPAASGKSLKHRKPHRDVHQVRHVTAVTKPQASAVVPPAPTPAPVSHPQPAPAPVRGHGHGTGHGIGYGVGHGSRGSTSHLAAGHTSTLVATVVDHDRAGHSRGHSHHDGTDGGRGQGGRAHGDEHHFGHSGSGRGQHR